VVTIHERVDGELRHNIPRSPRYCTLVQRIPQTIARSFIDTVTHAERHREFFGRSKQRCNLGPYLCHTALLSNLNA
jgi:hypothetical protein